MIIGAIVINWNGAEDTLELLESLGACNSEAFTLRVAVVDNASAQSDREAVRRGIAVLQRALDISLLENSINVGVPAAYNQAVQLLGERVDHVLRLDNDVIVTRAGLESMIHALELHAGVGVVGGNVKFYDHREQDNGGAVSIDLVRGTTVVTYPSHATFCDGVLGCIMLIRGELARRYAPLLFDPSLFICADESELSLRARADGFRTFYVPDVVGFHKGGRSTSRASVLADYFSARNWTILRLTYVSAEGGRLRVLCRLTVDALKSAVKGRWVFHRGLASGLGAWVCRTFDARARRRGR